MEEELNRQALKLSSPLKQVKRSQLFSPAKLPQQSSSSGALPSPGKESRTRSPAKLTLQSIKDMAFSPSKELRSKSPAKLTLRTIEDMPSKELKSKSPAKLTQQSIHDMLFSPTKEAKKINKTTIQDLVSPAKEAKKINKTAFQDLVSPAKEAKKINKTTFQDLVSPGKESAIRSSARQTASAATPNELVANLFGSPTKSTGRPVRDPRLSILASPCKVRGRVPTAFYSVLYLPGSVFIGRLDPLFFLDSNTGSSILVNILIRCYKNFRVPFPYKNEQ